MEYVGLRNHGGTGYLNSIFQQLFMEKEFRETILNFTFSKQKEQLNENELVLYELKNIFHILAKKQVEFTETLEFCKVFKDWEGNPINPRAVMDCSEFMSMLFDKLDSASTGIIKNLFGGTISHQIVCREGNHINEREESFFSISLDVRGHTSFLGSFSKFCEAEMLEGENQYYCVSCGKKVDATKRQIIKKMPKNLIVHLKRYDFDYNTFQRIKLNSYFEFPLETNLKKFTLQNENQNQNENLNFTLHGIIVHKGTVNAGQNYSIINTKEKWIKFDDKKISEYNTADIDQDFYGGLDKNNKEKMQSAYILFYKKN
ncbi:ubiquitin carboxyl-terminal hydrolase [Anaeramoeba flamelloides]|uniref:Ubiquitin carboxyl-terminal hydrolase n=1 Tax=Anaeramoeba flamelloides TaxID=1746091 RepID=A0ABQ8XCU9_9EUKA|nr:ubiquitin carboxyl-terminal hydrolase [Anaeramoeba flamelloides]